MRADGVPDKDLETSWMARLRRQQILGTVDYTAYIAEAALQTAYGGADALEASWSTFWVPRTEAYGSGSSPPHQTQVLLLHSWMWMRFPNTTPVVHVELSAGAFYVHNQDVAPYTVALERLDQIALSQGDSRKLISDLMKEL